MAGAGANYASLLPCLLLPIQTHGSLISSTFSSPANSAEAPKLRNLQDRRLTADIQRLPSNSHPMGSRVGADREPPPSPPEKKFGRFIAHSSSHPPVESFFKAGPHGCLLFHRLAVVARMNRQALSCSLSPPLPFPPPLLTHGCNGSMRRLLASRPLVPTCVGLAGKQSSASR